MPWISFACTSFLGLTAHRVSMSAHTCHLKSAEFLSIVKYLDETARRLATKRTGIAGPSRVLVSYTVFILKRLYGALALICGTGSIFYGAITTLFLTAFMLGFISFILAGKCRKQEVDRLPCRSTRIPHVCTYVELCGIGNKDGIICK